MLQLFEPTQQLTAALVLGACTLCAALVNAVAQMRVARQVRRNPRKTEEVPPAAPRVRRWVVLGATVALALGWSAAERVQASSVASSRVFGAFGHEASDAKSEGGLAVALVELDGALGDSALAEFLQDHELRPYAVDFRLAEDDARWHPVSVATAPLAWAARLRAAAVRSALHQACGLEALTVDASPGVDSVALALVRGHADAARERAGRLASGVAMSHAVRVVGTSSALIDLTDDPRVADAELWRWDPAVPLAPLSPDSLGSDAGGCEVVRLDAEHGLIREAAR